MNFEQARSNMVLNQLRANRIRDIDLIENGSRKIVILCHGLEGSSDSKYIQATAKLLSLNGYSVAAMNYRFCSGEINRQLVTYHSGKTDDLHTVINFVLPNYDSIYLVGFSLGGNLILKYNGDGLFSLSPTNKLISEITRFHAVPAKLHDNLDF